MKPLADSLRPGSLSEVVGQKRLCGEDGIITRILESGNIPNMIFYGVPGVGKTTVASIIAEATNRKIVKLNGTTASTADVKEVVEQIDTLLAPGGVLLYLDEIQYFNKKQQQSLLSFVENGKITLIASTTENPYFYVYPALLSRCTVFEFKPVEPQELMPVIDKAIAVMSANCGRSFAFAEEIKKAVALSCGGDVRKCLNSIELLCLSASGDEISEADAELVLEKSAVRYDRDADAHYDILSAFQKSIRGSDPDAAIHYLARLVSGGDLPSICRRLLVIAAEDIGLAHPQAIATVKACVDAANQLGFPEARIPLAEAVLLLATAPKSNSAIMAIDAAMSDYAAGRGKEVPNSLKDTHYSGSAKLGRGGYKYAHSYKNHYVKQQYLPDDIKDAVYYEYGDNKLERAAKEYWDIIKGEK